jgi:hypothetical protein
MRIILFAFALLCLILLLAHTAFCRLQPKQVGLADVTCASAADCLLKIEQCDVRITSLRRAHGAE